MASTRWGLIFLEKVKMTSNSFKYVNYHFSDIESNRTEQKFTRENKQTKPKYSIEIWKGMGTGWRLNEKINVNYTENKEEGKKSIQTTRGNFLSKTMKNFHLMWGKNLPWRFGAFSLFRQQAFRPVFPAETADYVDTDLAEGVELVLLLHRGISMQREGDMRSGFRGSRRDRRMACFFAVKYRLLSRLLFHHRVEVLTAAQLQLFLCVVPVIHGRPAHAGIFLGVVLQIFEQKRPPVSSQPLNKESQATIWTF